MGKTFLILAVCWFSSALANQNFSTSTCKGEFDPKSGVLRSFRPITSPDFDFSPSDYFDKRNGVGNYHTGDFVLRWRRQGQDAWQELDTAMQRNGSLPTSSTTAKSLLTSNFDKVFPDAAPYLNITREWKTASNGDLQLLTRVVNRGSETLELGSFGFPLEFNNIFTNRTREEIADKCSLVDPYIGMGAGYVQVTRLAGVGPHLVLTPVGRASNLEAWRFLKEAPGDLHYQSPTFEGLYSWEIHSLAYAQNEWSAVKPWNQATSRVLTAGQRVLFGMRFSFAPEVQDIESTVTAVGRPVAVGIPGFVLPKDLVGQLFLRSVSNITSIVVDPPESLNFVRGTSPLAVANLVAYTVRSAGVGRARATITYADKTIQTVHYFGTESAPKVVGSLGRFMFGKQLFTDTSDPFFRAPSIITYDRDAGAQVLQEARSWIAGLSGEGGSNYIAAALQTAVFGNAEQVQRLEAIATQTIAGRLQDTKTNGSLFPFGVKRSLFFYDPALVPGFQYNPNINFKSPTSFTKAVAYRVDRAYDYVHASAIYYGLYAASRSVPGILKVQSPLFYLRMAYQTALDSQALGTDGKPLVRFAQFGLIGETLWARILAALAAENLTKEFTALENAMRSRQLIWKGQVLPFGSPRLFDTIAQEGVYLWSRYVLASRTLY